MSKYLMELGASVVISSRKLDVLQKTADELQAETGGRRWQWPCDVRIYEEVEQMLQQAVDAFGQVDGLLNNAAGNFISPTERLSHRAFDTVVDIVLKGSYNCTLALGKYWIEKEDLRYGTQHHHYLRIYR